MPRPRGAKIWNDDLQTAMSLRAKEAKPLGGDRAVWIEAAELLKSSTKAWRVHAHVMIVLKLMCASHTHVHINTHARACMYTNMLAHMHAHTDVCVYAFAHGQKYVR